MIVETKRISQSWWRGYNEARKYARIHGSLHDIKARYVCENGYKLGSWVTEQKHTHRSGAIRTISVEQVELLTELGINWGADAPYAEYMALFLEHMKAYWETEGHCKISKKYICDDGYRLGPQVQVIRMRHRQGKLPEYAVEELDKIGFIWEPKENNKLAEEDG